MSSRFILLSGSLAGTLQRGSSLNDRNLTAIKQPLLDDTPKSLFKLQAPFPRSLFV